MEAECPASYFLLQYEKTKGEYEEAAITFECVVIYGDWIIIEIFD